MFEAATCPGRRMNRILTPKKLLIRIACAAVLLLVVMLVCSLMGTQNVSLKKVFLSGHSQTAVNPDYEILVRVRLPRIILAALVGLRSPVRELSSRRF